LTRPSRRPVLPPTLRLAGPDTPGHHDIGGISMVAITRKHILAGVVGGAVAGPLDLLAATAQFGAPLDVICRSVAAGWVGRDVAMAGGLPMALLGFFSDLGISVVAALIYCVVTPPREIARPWL